MQGFDLNTYLICAISLKLMLYKSQYEINNQDPSKCSVFGVFLTTNLKVLLP